MLPFLHDVCSKQSRGSSTGPEVRATVGRLVATEHLKCAVGSGNEIWSKETKKQRTFHLVHFVYQLVKSD